MGEAEDFSVNADNLSLNVDTQSLLTLIAINAGKLEQQSAVNNQYVSEVIANPALPLAQGLWVTDAAVGNQKNALAFSRAVQPFQLNNKAVHGVVTVAYVNEQINDTLARLLDPQVQQVLLNGDSAQIAAALNGKPIPQATTQTTSTASAAPSVAAGSVVGTFTIRNEHGLHARPSAILVNEVKKFTSKITVENLTRGGVSVNAKSLMKIVALGVTQGHRLRFVAEGDDAQAAMEAIGKVISAGLGEGVSAVPPSEPDTIEVAGDVAPATSAPSSESAEENSSESVEGVFEVKNEHGLHARPAAVLVNEVKKYNANIVVQNLDRDTPLVSAKSLMKVVALGVVKGHRLRFVASGEQAQQAIDGIGAVINAGLGE
ncbi:Pseudo-HPr [Aggregatibacter aphrophilus]|nr:Pseudo-HPr [Aggregatibacter aphrophilus]